MADRFKFIIGKRAFVSGRRSRPEVVMPALCACCGGTATQSQRKTAQRKELSFSFEVPSCAPCLVHARERRRRGWIANFLGLGMVAIIAGFLIYAFGIEILTGVPIYYVLIGGFVGLIVGAIVGAGLNAVMWSEETKAKGRTPSCTEELEVKLEIESAGMISDSTFALWIVSSNPAFSAAFETTNPTAEVKPTHAPRDDRRLAP